MQDLSLHVLDIVQNSLRAGAMEIRILIDENLQDDTFTIIVKDNGKGMTQEMVENVKDPFVTTRRLRRVGLGIPLFSDLCKACEGDLEIKSIPKEGTTIKAVMRYNHIDRIPLGDMAATLVILIGANPKVIYYYEHIYQQKHFLLSTQEIKELLGDVDITVPKILSWLEIYIKQSIEEIRK